jgi:hypothetical protein
MTNEELNKAVAEKVMGEKPAIIYVKPYSTDANHVREVEAEIERRGLKEQWISALYVILGGDESTCDCWDSITASPADRCKAALKAVEEGRS